jgi:hypothetical protein
LSLVDLMKLNLQSKSSFNSAPESGTDNKENREACDRHDRGPHPVQLPVRLTSVLTARFTWYSPRSLEEHAQRFTNVFRKPYSYQLIYLMGTAIPIQAWRGP